MNTATEFVNALRTSTLKADGWDLFAVYSQARMETGNFKTLPQNNFWGMMPRPDCPYPFEVHTTKEWEIVNGVNTEVTKELKFNIYPTAIEGILDYVKMVQNKFPTQAYPFRGDYQRYYHGLISLAKTKEGQTIVVYPSFSSYPKYAELCIKNYEDYKKDNELFQLITGA